VTLVESPLHCAVSVDVRHSLGTPGKGRVKSYEASLRADSGSVTLEPHLWSRDAP